MRGGGLSNTCFSLVELLGDQKLSQIFSIFFGIHFYELAFWENHVKLFQIFSNVLMFFSNFLIFFSKIFAPNDGGGSRSGGGYR